MTDVFLLFFSNLQTQYKGKKMHFLALLRSLLGYKYIFIICMFILFISMDVQSTLGKTHVVKRKWLVFFFLFTWLWHMVWRGQNLDATERLRWQHHTLKLIKPCLVVKGDPHPSRPEPIKTLANQVRTG